MAINVRDLGGGSTVGIYRPYQRPKTNEEEETVETTPANNPESSTLGTVAGVATTVDNGAKLYERYNGANIDTSGIGETSFSDNRDSISSGQNVGEFEAPAFDYRYNVSQNTPNISVDNNDFISYVNEHYDNLALLKSQNDLINDNQNAITIDGLVKGTQSPFTYKINDTGDKAQINIPGFRTDDGVVGARNLGDVGLDWWTARNVALPVLQYAAQYQQLDTKGKWIQSGKTLQKIMQGFAGKYEGSNVPAKTVLDDYYISNFVDIADMTTNWSNRSDFNNAITASNAAMNMVKNFGWEQYLGGADVYSNTYDGLAMLNFGNSLYHLTTDWDKLNDGERTAASVQTLLAGTQAYDGGTSLIKAFSSAADLATPTANMAGAANLSPVSSTAADFTTPAFDAKLATDAPATVGENFETPSFDARLASEAGAETSGATIASTVGNAAGAIMGAYSMAKGIEGMADSIGYGTAASRKAGAISGAMAGAGAVAAVTGGAAIASAIATGALVGSAIPIVGTIIGAVVGAAIGVVVGSINSGKSKEQRARDNWRQVYADTGVFSKSMKADGSGHSMAMQLSDGRWYDVGIDGSGSRARMMDGTAKTFANPTAVQGGSKLNKEGFLSPYDVDYTNALDFVGSLMMGGMIIPIGGSYQKNRSAEVPQMLGYMTNGITSNCGREFTLENYNVMTANAKTLYAKIGITNKNQMINCVSDAYFQGKLSKADYYNMLLSSNLIYDENGYQQAQGMLANSDKAGMGKTDNTTGTVTAPENTGE